MNVGTEWPKRYCGDIFTVTQQASSDVGPQGPSKNDRAPICHCRSGPWLISGPVFRGAEARADSDVNTLKTTVETHEFHPHPHTHTPYHTLLHITHTLSLTLHATPMYELTRHFRDIPFGVWWLPTE